MKQILVVDDERGSRESLKAIFSREYDVVLAERAEEAIAYLTRNLTDIVLCDVVMPGKDGLELLKEIRALSPEMPVIMISASTSVRPIVSAMKDGAYDFITKPFDVEEIRRVVRRALETSLLQRRVEVLEDEMAREFPVNGIVGESETFQHAMEDARKSADSDATVLILGESGTGKELTARLIHAASPRVQEPFVAVHCAALSESLMESELFGHEKGAFTGADRQKPGRFDLAGSGTLFFDEVSEMTMSTQVKLLRVLQEREFMRVGGTRVIKTDARIVCAAAKDLKEEVRKGTFRDDLYYRLSVVPVVLPPLRDRIDDIPMLCVYFLKYFSARMDVLTEGFEPEAMEALARYDWPGNIRELRNIMERVLVLHGRNRLITADVLPGEFHKSDHRNIQLPPEDVTLHEAVSSYEKRLIERALDDAQGVQTLAATKLGTTRRILRYRMEKLDITVRTPQSAPDDGNGSGDVEHVERNSIPASTTTDFSYDPP
jgi:DNA-binding NtrC family response regulator